MREAIVELLHEAFPSYSIKQKDSIDTTVRIRMLKSKRIVGKTLGLFPKFEYDYEYKDIPFKEVSLKYKQRFLYKVVSEGSISIYMATDEFNKVIYWKYSF